MTSASVRPAPPWISPWPNCRGGELEVEAMAALYRRAQRYADRCEAVLLKVEQEVMQWDAKDPQQDPQPYQP